MGNSIMEKAALCQISSSFLVLDIFWEECFSAENTSCSLHTNHCQCTNVMQHVSSAPQYMCFVLEYNSLIINLFHTVIPHV